jgi:hypothetical protein
MKGFTQMQSQRRSHGKIHLLRRVKQSIDTIVVGGGAAGFFAAIHAAANGEQRVVLLEKTNKVLTKVAVSGGGRCNVTHDCAYAAQLVKKYPRGGKSLRKGFERFGTAETMAWFESRGVPLKTEADGRVFPTSNNSQSIVDCLKTAAEKAGVQLWLQNELKALQPLPEGGFEVKLKAGGPLICRKVILTTGGFNKAEGYHFVQALGIKVAPPVPSLFTFNVPDSDLKDLMGLSVPMAHVQVPGSKWKEEGPVLITHWGFSAPAVIKLSAWAAIDLHGRQYLFPILINWTGLGEESIKSALRGMRVKHPRKVVQGAVLFDLPARLWERLCSKAEIAPDLRHADLSAKALNRLVELLVRSAYQVRGKTTFKEEFVTCGGVELSEVQLDRFESKKVPGLYFAGELLNVDGVTGGFNFQHAWTSAYLAGCHAGGYTD